MSRTGVREGRGGPAAPSGASPRATRRPTGALLIENPAQRETAAWGAGEPRHEEAGLGVMKTTFSRRSPIFKALPLGKPEVARGGASRRHVPPLGARRTDPSPWQRREYVRARPAQAAGGAAMSLLSGPRPRLRGAARKGPRKATAAKRDWDVSAVTMAGAGGSAPGRGGPAPSGARGALCGGLWAPIRPWAAGEGLGALSGSAPATISASHSQLPSSFPFLKLSYGGWFSCPTFFTGPEWAGGVGSSWKFTYWSIQLCNFVLCCCLEGFFFFFFLVEPEKPFSSSFLAVDVFCRSFLQSTVHDLTVHRATPEDIVSVTSELGLQVVVFIASRQWH